MVTQAEPPKETKPEEPPPPAAVVSQPSATPPSADPKPVLTLELGVAGENRSFEYAGFRSRDLRAYSMPFFTSVALAVELSPFREGPLSGLSLEGSGTVAPWLQTAVSPDRTVPTTSARADAGLVYRLPIGASAFTLLGRVNFHFQSFTLAEPLGGLPNAVYLGLRAGVGGEFRFAERFTAFLNANALPMFSSRDLVSSAFFSRGANVGLEVRGGLVVKVTGPLSVRASVEWTRYFFVLDSNLVQDTFAQGAVDQYLGGQLAARVAF